MVAHSAHKYEVRASTPQIRGVSRTLRRAMYAEFDGVSTSALAPSLRSMVRRPLIMPQREIGCSDRSLATNRWLIFLDTQAMEKT